MSQLNLPNISNNSPRTIFQGGQFHLQSQRVLREGKRNKITNTNRAYDPKMLEFQQFCHSIYGNTLDAQLVTEEKNFAFLYY